ncbi:TetR/AcrR family transcriptional regulator [Actinomadura sp. WMMB 499]|uniref:TetR/AcrR family transcriptional regulator n=1 Tax=Actinomadura sp. WMMB 499 TaxID=1219491 RepID=UPI001244E13A|nr:TetR/AcrR family transcriptional regulator C-terminal domain-containing protein [Actinomadura sp. WMMB 499]QFG26242.1 TetR family transcriptional regulator [Actinomadura sp. WMMB 499]
MSPPATGGGAARRHAGGSRGPRSARAQEPLTAAQIVEAGVALTAERGLSGWSLRDLAAALDCWPTAIAHHVGDRNAVEIAVVDAILGRTPMPDPDLAWRPWFRTLLASLRSELLAHPGVARWLGVAAPIVPSATAIIEEGVRRLSAAGFGDEAPAAYVTLINAMVHLIAAEDDRDAAPKLRDSSGDRLAELRDDRERPGVAALATALTSGFKREQIFAYTVDRTLDGVEARLTALRGTGRGQAG